MNNRLQRLERRVNKTSSGRHKGKTMRAKGTDFVRKVDLYPEQLLDGDIKLVATYDISPSSFPNTRLELLSNTYQMYKFEKLKITYSTLLPTAVNGLFIAYIDTDPADDSILSANYSSVDVLRIARSHQGSVQGKVNSNWSCEMPIRDDDQFFFIGDEVSANSSDTRFRVMGKLHIFQVGQATGFDGKPIAMELSAGALNIEWSCTFMNPQLQSLTRVYDGTSEKDVYRLLNSIDFYREYDQVVDVGRQIGIGATGTRFRHIQWILDKDLFSNGIGDYIICTIPLKYSTQRSIKTYATLALPYSSWKGKPYDTLKDLRSLGVDGFVEYVNKVFQYGKKALEIASTVYDVITIASSVFIAGQIPSVSNTVDICDPLDNNLDTSDENLPLGQVVVRYDGIHSPLIEEVIEYETAACAGAPEQNMTYKKLFIAFKIERPINNAGNNTDIIEPNLPKVAL